MNLDAIENDIQKCRACSGLTKLGCNTISYGTNTGLIFVGESPAKNGWILTGRAFYDGNGKLLPTGRVLNKLLKILDLSIDDITFTEACKCHIPDRKLLKQASANCLTFLERQIVGLGAKVVIPLGEHPTRILIRENFSKYRDVVGKTFRRNILGKEVLIIPIYHPSPINPKSYHENVPIFEAIGKVLAYYPVTIAQ